MSLQRPTGAAGELQRPDRGSISGGAHGRRQEEIDKAKLPSRIGAHYVPLDIRYLTNRWNQRSVDVVALSLRRAYDAHQHCMTVSRPGPRKGPGFS
jgi:hypothetical protein